MGGDMGVSEADGSGSGTPELREVGSQGQVPVDPKNTMAFRLEELDITSGAPAPESAMPRNFAPEIDDLQEALKELQSLIPGRPQFADDPSIKSEKGPNLATTLDVIKRTARSFATLVSYIEAVNELGEPTANRSIGTGASIIPVAVSVIEARGKVGKNPPTEGEERLASVFRACHYLEIRANGERIKWPDWFSVIGRAVEPLGSNGKLPGPEAYLEHSRSMAASTKEKRAAVALLSAEIDRLRSSRDSGGGPSGADTIAKQEEKEGIVAELDEELRKAGDVDPAVVDSCCRNVRIELMLALKVTDAVREFHSALGNIIGGLATGNIKEEAAPVLKCTEFNSEDTAGSKVRRIERMPNCALRTGALFKEEERENVLGVLLEEYNATGLALRKLYERSKTLGRGLNDQWRNTVEGLEKSLSFVIGSDRADSSAILLKLGELKSEPVRRNLAVLLGGEVYDGQGGRSRSFNAMLGKPENMQVLGLALELIARGDDQISSWMCQCLHGQSGEQIREAGLRIRDCIKKKDYATLVNFFDAELKNVQQDGDGLVLKKEILLLSLLLASEDESARVNLKARFKNLEAVNEVASGANKALERYGGSTSLFVEKVRADIIKRFSFGLSDYRGLKDVVADLKSNLEEHIELISHPELWEGIPAKKVFRNGHILHGETGGGKTFLVLCIASELGIPLVEVSGKSMREALAAQPDPKDGLSVEKDVEARFAKLLKDKIANAKANMEKSKAKACILSLEEAEALFLRRDPVTSTREDFARTNSLLVVLEDVIRKHPEIIFVATTNYIEIMDPAALRRGRFGVHYEVRMPKEEDVRDLINGSLLDLDIEGREKAADVPPYNDLVKDCVGLPPLTIEQIVTGATLKERKEKGINGVKVNTPLFEKMVEMVRREKRLDFFRKGGKKPTA